MWCGAYQVMKPVNEVINRLNYLRASVTRQNPINNNIGTDGVQKMCVTFQLRMFYDLVSYLKRKS